MIGRLKKHRVGEQGFTLMELMIVVTIIGVLSLVGMTNFIRYRRNAKVARTATEMRGLSTAFVAY